MNEIKEMLRQLNKGKQVEENLPAYVETLNDLYHRMALLNLSMEYYLLYDILQDQDDEDRDYLAEILDDGDVKNEKYLSDNLAGIHRIIDRVFCRNKELQKEEAEELTAEVKKIRTDVKERMEFLTIYADKYTVFEYVTERMGLQFVSDFEETDPEDFIVDTLQYIFEEETSSSINANIREVLSELPVRMARSKYFQMLEDGISVYKGMEKSMLNRFLYMIKPSMFLSEPKTKGKYYREFQSVADKLEGKKFSEMPEEEFDKISFELMDSGVKMDEIGDFYMDMQPVINDLYAYLISYEGQGEEDKISNACVEILKIVQSLFEAKKWEPVPEENDALFQVLMGKQEKIAADIMKLEGLEEFLWKNYKSKIEELGLAHNFQNLEILQKLLANHSTFVDFDEEEDDTIVDDSYIHQKTAELVEQLKERFEKQDIRVNRGVIAKTISKFPGFFTSSEELEEHIRESITRCQDVAERQSSINIITSLWEDSIW